MTPGQRLVFDHLSASGHDVPEILRMLDDWRVVSYFDLSGLVAAMLVKGPELHFVIAPDARGKGKINRRMARALLGPIFERYGYATTRIERGQEERHEFVTRLGFRPTWSDAKFTYLMLAEPPFRIGV